MFHRKQVYAVDLDLALSHVLYYGRTGVPSGAWHAAIRRLYWKRSIVALLKPPETVDRADAWRVSESRFVYRRRFYGLGVQLTSLRSSTMYAIFAVYFVV